MKSNLLKRLLKKTYDNSLTRKLTVASTEIYIQIFEKEKLANLNIDDVIDTNWQAAKNVFVGFVGHPSQSDDVLMYYSKTIDKNKNSNRNFLLAQNFVNRLGFILAAVEVPDTETFRVILTPGPDIYKFLTAKALEEKFHGVDELYTRIR